MTTNLDLARPVSGNVELRSINLAEASVRSTLDPLAPPPDQVLLSQGYRASYRVWESSPDAVVVYVDLTFMAGAQVDEGEEALSDDSPSVTLDARYVIVYNLKSADQYGDEALKAFAELNGTYNVWPYWREMVQTVTGRVGLTSVVVPVLKLPVRQIETGEVAQPVAKPRSKKSKK